MTAVVAPQHPGLWQRRPDQPMHMANMNLSNMMPAYDTSRNVSNPPSSSRVYQPTTSHMDMAMPLFSTHALPTSVPYQSGAFAFDSLSVNPYNMQQAFPVSYPPAISHAVSYAPAAEIQALPTVRDARNAFPMERTSPPVKSESQVSSPAQPNQLYNEASFGDDYKTAGSDSGDGANINFSTDVDTLMKAIQAREKQRHHHHHRPLPAKVRDNHHTAPPEARHSLQQQEEPRSGQKPKKRYQCSIPDCGKSFYQKTHLEIHTRAHTGIKPFLCKEPGCGQRFSQLGNLKTHERRHTGERPYSCDICGKTFAQRGNVRAHKIVHQQIKPFTCRLDDCGKQFTQLGNLKSHQNKFHANTLQFLTRKFANIHAGQVVNEQDKDLWEYFAGLYKNSNKGIKGRGKDRRISTASASAVPNSSLYTPTTAASMGRNFPGAFHHPGSDRSRSSSMSSDEAKPHDGYDFNSPLQAGFQGQPTGYDDMVFPERKLY